VIVFVFWPPSSFFIWV